MIRRACIVGIGSNIEPLSNVPRVVDLLVEEFTTLYLSSFFFTDPVGLDTKNRFVNGVVAFETNRGGRELKELLNSFETSLGRDRAHPLSSSRDRPADLDILYLGLIPAGGGPLEVKVDSYYRAPLGQLLRYLRGQGAGERSGLRMSVRAQSFGEAAATVHRQRGAGDKGVV